MFANAKPEVARSEPFHLRISAEAARPRQNTMEVVRAVKWRNGLERIFKGFDGSLVGLAGDCHDRW
jgi:hypothetical protein